MARPPLTFLGGLGSSGGVQLLGMLGDPCAGDVVGQIFPQPQTCDCPTGYAWTYNPEATKFWCQAIKPTKDGGWKFDWSQLPGAISSAVSIACKLFNAGCPAPYSSGGGVPAGYYDPPWYSTAGGMIGIVGGLALVGGLGYMVVKKRR